MTVINVAERHPLTDVAQKEEKGMDGDGDDDGSQTGGAETVT